MCCNFLFCSCSIFTHRRHRERREREGGRASQVGRVLVSPGAPVISSLSLSLSLSHPPLIPGGMWNPPQMLGFLSCKEGLCRTPSHGPLVIKASPSSTVLRAGNAHVCVCVCVLEGGTYRTWSCGRMDLRGVWQRRPPRQVVSHRSGVERPQWAD